MCMGEVTVRSSVAMAMMGNSVRGALVVGRGNARPSGKGVGQHQDQRKTKHANQAPPRSLPAVSCVDPLAPVHDCDDPPIAPAPQTVGCRAVRIGTALNGGAYALMEWLRAVPTARIWLRA